MSLAKPLGHLPNLVSAFDRSVSGTMKFTPKLMADQPEPLTTSMATLNDSPGVSALEHVSVVPSGMSTLAPEPRGSIVRGKRGLMRALWAKRSMNERWCHGW